MGYEHRDIGSHIALTLDSHGGDREREDEQLAEELERELQAAVLAVLSQPRFRRILVFEPEWYGPPRNRLGITEVEWNEWARQSAEWVAAHPVPPHQPHQVCDCTDIPTAPGRSIRGHCAAVGAPVPWAETVD